MSANGKTDELTPRQFEFLSYYNNPKSPTFGNALQSALKAGFAQEYAETITAQMPEWLSENLGRRKRLLHKAEQVLEDSLDWEEKNLRLDSAKFIAKTQGKDEGYSDRVEHTGKNGTPLTITTVNYGGGKTDNDTASIPTEGISDSTTESTG